MFKVVSTPDELFKVYAVRSIVFVEEQRCPWDEEFDGLDEGAVHILGEQDGEPVAAGRIRLMGDYAKLERIAVRPTYRGRGVGDRLVKYMLDVARRYGCTTFRMHAQAHLTGFYRAHSFDVCGGLFQEAGIDHYPMIRQD